MVRDGATGAFNGAFGGDVPDSAAGMAGMVVGAVGAEIPKKFGAAFRTTGAVVSAIFGSGGWSDVGLAMTDFIPGKTVAGVALKIAEKTDVPGVRRATEWASRRFGGSGGDAASRGLRPGDIDDYGRRYLGNGSFSDAYLQGDQVVKEVKEVVGPSAGIRYRLDQNGRRLLAEHTTEFTNDLRQADGFANIVPQFRNRGPGRMEVDFRRGSKAEDLPTAEARLRAIDEQETAVERAHRYFGIEPNGSGTIEGGWKVQVDPNGENFLFNQDGSIAAWIDPVMVWPPASLQISP
jgi:hypothetical protein